MSNKQNDKAIWKEPEWYLNLREFRIEVGGEGSRVEVGRTFRQAIHDSHIEDAKKGKVIDIESEKIE